MKLFYKKECYAFVQMIKSYSLLVISWMNQDYWRSSLNKAVFQSIIVLGSKDFFLCVVLLAGEFIFIFLDIWSGGMSLCPALMFTLLFFILYNIASLALIQFSCSFMSLTEDVSIPVCYISCRSSLYHIKFIFVFLEVWIPDRTYKLNSWSYQGGTVGPHLSGHLFGNQSTIPQ